MYNYGIGGNEVKLDASEAIADIPSNRTLLVQKLTEDDPTSPEAVYGLKNIDEVFQKFQPTVNVELETASGETKKETWAFGKLSDFSADQMIRQSPFLNELEIRQEQYTKMARQLSSNKVLQKALSDDATRVAVLQAIEAALKELGETK
jgi:predicted component of type VI protein secretion system